MTRVSKPNDSPNHYAGPRARAPHQQELHAGVRDQQHRQRGRQARLQGANSMG